MSNRHEEFMEELQRAVDEDRVMLPTLPEVAISVRNAVESEHTNTKEIADIIAMDPALSARLIKVVNSPLYRCDTPIDDLHTAVTRMGVRLVRDLIMNLAIKQMYQPTSAAVDALFREAWNTSVGVAAICHLIATSMQGIRREQALFAGLIHNIGALPLLRIIGSDDELFDDLAELSKIIIELQGRVGALLLESWDFSDELIAVVKECHNFNYVEKDGPGLVNLVQIALIEGGYADDELTPEDFNKVPAFAMLGLDPATNITTIEENRAILEDARQTLTL